MERAAAAASDKSRAIEKIQALEPTWEDLKAEGVIDYIPETDGKFTVSADGKRFLQMREAALKAESEFCDVLHAEIPKVKIRGRNGETQYVPEKQAEARERKHFKPKAMFVVPEMPWHKEKP